MTRALCSLLLSGAVTSAFPAELPDCFLGRWRSDAALTVADMRKHPEITEKARALFENAFFGRLVIVVTQDRSGGYLEPHQDRSSLVLEPFDVVTATSRSAVIRTKVMGAAKETEWFCDEGHIYALVTRWQFREYFSPE